MADYASQTVAQLKEVLKSRGLSIEGKKADLVQRLTEQDNSEQQDELLPIESAETTEVEQKQEKEEVADAVPAVGAEDEVKKPEENTTDSASGAVEEAKEEKPKPKVLTAEERKQLAVDFLNKKIQRAEKFGDESGAQEAKKDLARVEKFGVELGTTLAREIGLVDKSLNNGFKKNFHKKNFKKNFKPRHNKNRR